MHMADALVSPAVGGTFWVVSASVLAWSARKLQQTLAGHLVPMMGVLGAFIFAAQMINFSIPGTGSSGHLGGGLILTALLGPYAAFLVMASILTVQALFFADGGLLALGCNIFNLGFIPAFIAYPLIYRPLAQKNAKAWIPGIAAGVVALQLGSLCVVTQTAASGISELPFGKFLLLMSPIHLAIGLVEGLATAAIVAFVNRTRPEVFAEEPQPGGKLVPIFLLAAIVLGTGLSWFASSHPDGLEWSIARTAGSEETEVPESATLHHQLDAVQQQTAFLPDYDFKEPGTAGTSVAGLIGGLLTLLLAGSLGFLFKTKHVPTE